MTHFDRGDYVVAVSSGAGQRVRGYGSIGYSAGEELEVTSQSAEYLNVRKGSDGYVFRVLRSKVRPVTRRIGEVPEGGIDPDDPRVAWIFEDAGRLADRLGLCKDYDRLCDALGAPGRVRTFTIKLVSADGIEITAKVDARSKRQAEQKLREQVGTLQDRPRQIAVAA